MSIVLLNPTVVMNQQVLLALGLVLGYRLRLTLLNTQKWAMEGIRCGR